MNKRIKVKVLNESVNELPVYAKPGDAGMDVRANIKTPITLKPLERVIVPTGLKLEIPEGYECQVRPRSGLAAKHGITVLNAPGTVDASFRGQVGVILVNLSNEPYEIIPGERIAQFVFAKHAIAELESVLFLSETERGEGGFGHTGNK